jgi:putative oxidoreductase
MIGIGIGLLLLRAVLGLTLAAHGAQKLFGSFGGPGLKGAAVVMEQLGFKPGRRNALAAGLFELGGGLLLVIGAATPLAATVSFSVMIVAGVSAHLKGGFFLQNHGYEYTLVLGLAALSLAFTGPGTLSIDALFDVDVAGATFGVAALFAGIAGAAVQLATRQSATPVLKTP